MLVLMMLMSFTVEAGQHRSYKAKVEFKRSNPCPANGATRGKCEGYIIDHVKPLKRGGVVILQAICNGRLKKMLKQRISGSKYISTIFMF